MPLKTLRPQAPAALDVDPMPANTGQDAALPLDIREFHQGKRLLVVDDCEETLKRLKGDLTRVYGRVEAAKSADEALSMALAAAESGKPYDAVVLDLLIGDRQGHVLMKDLFNAMRQRGRQDMFPGVVINTASIMDKAVSDLSVGWDQYVADGLGKTYESLMAGGGRLGEPVVRHSKLDPDFGNLVVKIDLGIRRRMDGWGDALGFLERFDPKTVRAYVPAVLTHKIVEEAREAAIGVGRILDELAVDDTVRKTAWWVREGERTRRTVARLRDAHYTDVFSGTPQTVGRNLHDIAQDVVRLNPPGASEVAQGQTDAETARFIEGSLREWGSLVARQRSKINRLVLNYRESTKTHVDLREVLEAVVYENRFERESGIRRLEYHTDDRIIAGDPGLLKAAIQVPAKVAKERGSGTFRDYKILVCKADTPAAQGLDLTDSERQRLREMGFKRFFMIESTDTEYRPENPDDLYGEALTPLADLMREKRAYFTITNLKEGQLGAGLRFRLFLSVGDEEDRILKGLREKPQARPKPTGKVEHMGEEHNVFAGAGPGDITVIGEHPLYIDTGRGANYKGVIFEDEGKRFLSMACGHMDAAILVSEYARGKGAELSKAIDVGPGREAEGLTELLRFLNAPVDGEVTDAKRGGHGFSFATSSGKKYRLTGDHREAKLCEEGGRFGREVAAWDFALPDEGSRSIRIDDYSYVMCRSVKVNAYTENGINRFVLDRTEDDPRGLSAIRLLNDLGVAGPRIECNPHDRFGVL